MATTAGNQQQLIAFKRGYQERGIEIEKLNAKILELEGTIKKMDKLIPKKPKEDK